MLVAIGHGARAGTLPASWTEIICWMAYAGVDIFFVISGFIVSQAALRAGARTQEDGRLIAAFTFASRRIFRIFPLYWLALAIAILFGGWLGIAVGAWPDPSILAMATLTTMWIKPLSVAWTLAFEVYFYTCLTLLILVGGRRVGVAIGVWVALQILWINAPRFGWPNWGIGSNELIYEFIFGLAIAFLPRRFTGRWWPTAGVGFLVLWCVGTWLTSRNGLLQPAPRVATFGLASAFLLTAMLGLENKGKRVPGLVKRIGDASYSIYLWHLILFAVVYSFLGTTPMSYVAGLVMLIALGFLSHAAIEIPAMRLGDLLLRSLRDLATRRTAGGIAGEEAAVGVDGAVQRLPSRRK
jgi:peptidoglycan/LPS O-acetylase OafA/YrhL